MRQYVVQAKDSTSFYDFECPFCHHIICRTNKEIAYYKWDICYCGSKIIFDMPKQNIVEIPVEKIVYRDKIVEKIVEKPIQKTETFTKSLPVKKTTKKYDDSAYISLLKKLGMKTEQAKILIKDIIGMGIDPTNETLFTSKLLENLK